MQHGGNEQTALSRSRSGRIAVLAYLETPGGASTPTDIGGLLIGLNWETVGCAETPSAAQIHLTRLAMEDASYLEAAEEASDRALTAETTGVYARCPETHVLRFRR